jgi:phospholipase C
MQENRSFDNYFGTYPGVNGITSSICIPVNPNASSTPCVKPQKLTLAQNSVDDMPHTYAASVKAINGGAMNGYISAEGCNMTMGYYDATSIPYYWDYANHFVLSDNTFESALSYSLPNHWFMVAGQSPYVGFYVPLTINAPASELNSYVQQANSIPTLGDSMVSSGISWVYYDTPIPAGGWNGINTPSLTDYWNPFKAKNSSYTSTYSPHFEIRGQIFQDIKNGNLPSVSWVIPSAPISEHAPATVTWGMWWVASVVNAVAQSPYWQNTAILVAWDDYGGWYDNATPPVLNNITTVQNAVGQGAGIRVPMLIISPFAKPGYVDHTQYTFSSIMRFIENIFNLQPLTIRDATANDILNAFNFTQTSLQPVIEQLNSTQMSVVNQWAFATGGSVHPPNGGKCSYLGQSALASTGASMDTTIGDNMSGFINGNPD